MSIVRYISGLIVSVGLMSPALAFAQIYDGAGFAQNDDLDIQASVIFKIPLGFTDHRRLSNQPRVGFGLSLAKNDFDSPLGRPGIEKLNILNVGAYGFDTPSIELSGQEMFSPTFDALHANGSANKTGASAKGGNTKWILFGVAVAAVAVGTSVLINEATDDLIKDLEN